MSEGVSCHEAMCLKAAKLLTLGCAKVKGRAAQVEKLCKSNQPDCKIQTKKTKGQTKWTQKG
jgi:hypothetical protein